MWTLRCDGGSRGNPGPGALGFVLTDPEGREREARGEYRVKNEGLKPLHREARQRAAALAEVAYRSVGREDNARADQLVNEALDKVLGSESPR